MAEEKKLSELVLEEIGKRFVEEVNQANELLEWAVAAGKKIEPADLVDRIKKGQELLSRDGSIPTLERAQFESAYNQLAQLTSPVTWATLAATADEWGRPTLLAPVRMLRGKGISFARKHSRILWTLTFILLLLIVSGENLKEYLDTFSPQDSQTVDSESSTNWIRLGFWFSKLIPFMYGALGACAYLLRSCHKFIYERSFDPKRMQEYYNRLLLGFLAGGTIFLFITPDSLNAESLPQKITGPALAFLAGYITDFLYTTLERVAEAILPKKPAEE